MTDVNITHLIIETYADGDGTVETFDDFTDGKAMNEGEIRTDRPLSERTILIEVERWDNTNIDNPIITLLGSWRWNADTNKYERA